jgi:hypothetical protein
VGSVDRARKFDEYGIARGIDDAAVMFSHLGIDHIAMARFERCEGTFLVIAHEAAVARDIACKNSGQPSFDPRLGHEKCLKLPCLQAPSLCVGDGVCP